MSESVRQTAVVFGEVVVLILLSETREKLDRRPIRMEKVRMASLGL